MALLPGKPTKAGDYVGAGSVEFCSNQSAALFSENEHRCSRTIRDEEVTGLDLSRCQLKVRQHLLVSSDRNIRLNAMRMEVRSIAEDRGDFSAQHGPVHCGSHPACRGSTAHGKRASSPFTIRCRQDHHPWRYPRRSPARMIRRCRKPPCSRPKTQPRFPDRCAHGRICKRRRPPPIARKLRRRRRHSRAALICLLCHRRRDFITSCGKASAHRARSTSIRMSLRQTPARWRQCAIFRWRGCPDHPCPCRRLGIIGQPGKTGSR